MNIAGLPNARPDVRQGVSFLVAGLREVGSWPMSRRGHMGITPSDKVVPITYFGSAWATLRRAPCRDNQEGRR
jgi:hypothetical protein